MADILQKMEELKKMLKTVIDSATGKNLPQKNKEILSVTFQKPQELFDDLVTINNEVILLTNVDDQKKNLSGNLEYWNKLPAGAIKSDTDQFELLKNNSSTIRNFYRAGIDISEIVKFIY